MKKTRVYAIKESWFDTNCAVERDSHEDIHDISDEEFIYQAEEQGYVWSLLGFQNLINGEGSNNISLEEFKTLYYKFIDIEI
jgi:hypothetical protein